MVNPALSFVNDFMQLSLFSPHHQTRKGPGSEVAHQRFGRGYLATVQAFWASLRPRAFCATGETRALVASQTFVQLQARSRRKKREPGIELAPLRWSSSQTTGRAASFPNRKWGENPVELWCRDVPTPPSTPAFLPSCGRWERLRRALGISGLHVSQSHLPPQGWVRSTPGPLYNKQLSV